MAQALARSQEPVKDKIQLIMNMLDIVDEIHEALEGNEGDKLSPVFHALFGRHSFETIRLVRLMRK